MTTPDTNETVQFRLSLLLVTVVALVMLGIVVMAQSTPVIQNKVAREIALHASVDGMYFFDNGYRDAGDYLLIGQLPAADYSRGGVYFIGASEMNAGIMTWLLAPEERRLIHNYALGDLRHTDSGHLVRMLVEENGLLRAGGEKTTVILGLSYYMARRNDESGGYTDALFHRHGLYTYDWEHGIHRLWHTPIERFVRLERDRANRFLRALLLTETRVATVRPHPETRIHMLRTHMGMEWRSRMESEVRQLAAQIDYLQTRNVQVRAILHPAGSWHHRYPYYAAYTKLILPVLQARRVPTTDLTELLTDDEFFDNLHARYSGQVKLHAAYRDLALRSLAEMGIAVR